jgi:hypothetical protein
MNETQKHAAEVLKLKSQLDQAKADGKVTSVLEQQAAQQEAALLQSRVLADQLATELRAQEQQQQTVLEALRVNFASGSIGRVGFVSGSFVCLGFFGTATFGSAG